MTNTASCREPAYVSSHANLTCFQCKVSCATNGKFRGCLSFSSRSWSLEFTRSAQMPVQPAIPSPLVLETVPSVENSSCCNNTTKNQSLSGPVLLRHHKAYRSATRARALSPSLRARASPVKDVGSRHAHALARKNERRAWSYRGRRRRVPRFNSVSFL